MARACLPIASTDTGPGHHERDQVMDREHHREAGRESAGQYSDRVGKRARVHLCAAPCRPGTDLTSGRRRRSKGLRRCGCTANPTLALSETLGLQLSKRSPTSPCDSDGPKPSQQPAQIRPDAAYCRAVLQRTAVDKVADHASALRSWGPASAPGCALPSAAIPPCGRRRTCSGRTCVENIGCDRDGSPRALGAAGDHGVVVRLVVVHLVGRAHAEAERGQFEEPLSPPTGDVE